MVNRLRQHRDSTIANIGAHTRRKTRHAYVRVSRKLSVLRSREGAVDDPAVFKTIPIFRRRALPFTTGRLAREY